ncbi:hypothetical protein ACIQUQ_15110 [Streptomyces sp. NPDC101118]|uniref:hypothetical protein n=1 Tax=Streptomyces sp. NPDC101118 TaxID=3366109 RepID=UPI00382A562F
MLRRRIKFASVLTVVVLSLTGFATGHGHGSSGGGSKSRSGSDSDSGGGCSSSKKHNGTHSDSDYQEDSGNGSGATATATAAGGQEPVSVVIWECAGPDKTAGTRKSKSVAGSKPRTSALVQVTSNIGRPVTVEVEVDFLGGVTSTEIDERKVTVTLGAHATKEVEVPMTKPRKAADVKKCEVNGVSEVTESGSPAPGPSPSAS